jgi:hypothetical protein
LSTIGALTLGPGAVQAPALSSPSTHTSITAILGSDPVAAMAREVNLQETGYLHAVGEPGDTILEQGHATGTYDCSITVHLTIESGHKATAAFTVKPHGGSVTGTGTARFAQQGAYGYFGGTLAIRDGTGSFADASGISIAISGVVNRETFGLTVHVHGKISV